MPLWLIGTLLAAISEFAFPCRAPIIQARPMHYVFEGQTTMRKLDITEAKDLHQYLRQHPAFKDEICDLGELPDPYFKNLQNVRGVVLGADPSDGRCTPFGKVFGLDKEDSAYFRSILCNLEQVNLSLEDIYVENLCRNYFRTETSKNKVWSDAALFWLRVLRRELDECLKFGEEIPVLITTEYLYPILACSGQRPKAKQLYRTGAFLQPDQNYLNRVIIPFYRHPAYALEKWPEYQRMVMGQLPARDR